jgi:hypothetical protein
MSSKKYARWDGIVSKAKSATIVQKRAHMIKAWCAAKVIHRIGPQQLNSSPWLVSDSSKLYPCNRGSWNNFEQQNQ